MGRRAPRCRGSSAPRILTTLPYNQTFRRCVPTVCASPRHRSRRHNKPHSAVCFACLIVDSVSPSPSLGALCDAAQVPFVCIASRMRCALACPWSAASRCHRTALVSSRATPMPHLYIIPKKCCAVAPPWSAARRYHRAAQKSGKSSPWRSGMTSQGVSHPKPNGYQQIIKWCAQGAKGL